MRRFLFICWLGLFANPVIAAPIPTFDDPRALLVAIYDQIKAGEDWENFDEDASFDTIEAFSSTLHANYLAADADVKAAGNEIGVLDFSPFMNGQDSGGLSFAVGPAKIKGSHAAVTVSVTGFDPQEIDFELIDEGARGWKIDDILLPGYSGDPQLRLSQYFADRGDAY